LSAAVLLALSIVNQATAGEPTLLSDVWLDAVTVRALDARLLTETPAPRAPVIVAPDADRPAIVPTLAAVLPGRADVGVDGVRGGPDGGGLPTPVAVAARPGSVLPAGSGGAATVEAVGFGGDASALTAAAAFTTRTLGADGFVALLAARATGGQSAHAAGTAEAVPMAPLTARAAASGNGEGPGAVAALSVNTLAARGAGVTLSRVSVAAAAAGAGPATVQAGVVAEVPDTPSSPAMSGALDLRGTGEAGRTALAGEVQIVKGTTRGLIVNRYQAEACCGSGASVSVHSIMAPGRQPVMSASRNFENHRNGAPRVAGVSWALTSFGSPHRQVIPWR
jgi:hypothetical protein